MTWRWDVFQQAVPVVLQGAKITLLLSVLGIVIGTVIGMLVGLLRSHKQTHPALKVLHGLSTGYVELIRGTPFIVQMFLVYYGAPLFLGINFPPLPAGIAAISLNSGAYVSEIFRAGIQSIEKGQMEAGRSLGLTYWQTMRHIVLPQAVKRSLPPLGNEFIMLIKESSIVSVIGIQETMFKSRIVGSINYSPFEPLLVATFVYLAMTFVTGRLVAYLERRLKTGDQH